MIINHDLLFHVLFQINIKTSSGVSFKTGMSCIPQKVMSIPFKKGALFIPQKGSVYPSKKECQLSLNPWESECHLFLKKWNVRYISLKRECQYLSILYSVSSISLLYSMFFFFIYSCYYSLVLIHSNKDFWQIAHNLHYMKQYHKM